MRAPISKANDTAGAGRILRLVVRLRRRGRVLNVVTIYHFVVHLWLIAWPSEASLWAAVVAWCSLPLVAGSVWHASEKLHAARQDEDHERRRREFLSHNVKSVPTPEGQACQQEGGLK